MSASDAPSPDAGLPGARPLAVAGSGLALFRLGTDGRFLSVSRGLRSLLGAAPGRFDGALAADALAGNDADRAALGRAIDATDASSILIDAAHADGRTLTLAVTLTRADDGALDGVVQDITALARAEREYRAMFENASEGIYRSTPDGRQLRANPALARLNGYDSEAEQLASVNDIAREWYVDPKRRDAFKAILERDGTVTNFESEIYRHKTRERIWVSENARLIRDADGNPLYYEGTVRDITARKKSQERLADFLEVGSDWLWETDAENNFTYMSEGVARTGVNPKSVVGLKRLAPNSLANPDDPTIADHLKLVAAHKPFRDFRYVLRTQSGQTLPLSTSAKPIFDAVGNFRGYRGAAHDLSALVANEARLTEALAAAEIANAAKARFLANMSHELRTPLNAIIGFSEVMRDQLLGPLGEPRYAGYAKDINDSATVLLQLIQDILDMAKSEAGKLELEDGPVDLTRLVADALMLLRQRAAHDGVTLDNDVPPDLPPVRGDARRLRQVIVNLVSNAVKFTPPGGRVRVGARIAAEGGLIVEVADTGIGIPPDKIDTVFEPFVQLGGPAGRASEGTGLGLPLCRTLVDLHGGRIHLESTPGAGTRAIIHLPAERLLHHARQVKA